MTPKLFWKTTPRKFNVLCKVHARLNGSDKKTEPTKYGKGSKHKARQPIAKQPETFIDKIM